MSKERPTKDECALCRRKRYWKKNCPKLQKDKVISGACIAKYDEESNFSLVGITLICHSYKWILDLSYTYLICSNRASFLPSMS